MLQIRNPRVDELVVRLAALTKTEVVLEALDREWRWRAVYLGAALLYLGQDFTHTDVKPAATD